MVIEATEPTAAVVQETLRVARPGLRFSEVMTGMITMGITDPVAGYHDDAAFAMQLHATVTLPNLPAFVKDPNHKGQWRAAGSIPVLGGELIGTGDGDFGLFRRAIRNKKGVREMVYDTEFAVDGKRYTMRGRKVVEPSPATTTLYVQLFPTSGATGKPVAAGVLRLTLLGFIRQLLGMRVTGDFGWFDRCIQKLSFYRFFAKSLANTYLKGRRW
jgi:hypothetical protein